jgi:hypothetical protein
MVNALALFDAALLGVVEFACRYRRHQRMGHHPHRGLDTRADPPADTQARRPVAGAGMASGQHRGRDNHAPTEVEVDLHYRVPADCSARGRQVHGPGFVGQHPDVKPGFGAGQHPDAKPVGDAHLIGRPHDRHRSPPEAAPVPRCAALRIAPSAPSSPHETGSNRRPAQLPRPTHARRCSAGHIRRTRLPLIPTRRYRLVPDNASPDRADAVQVTSRQRISACRRQRSCRCARCWCGEQPGRPPKARQTDSRRAGGRRRARRI